MYRSAAIRMHRSVSVDAAHGCVVIYRTILLLTPEDDLFDYPYTASFCWMGIAAAGSRKPAELHIVRALEIP